MFLQGRAGKYLLLLLLMFCCRAEGQVVHETRRCEVCVR
jgi:hypothetical protein